jgi:hypothetical protein
MNEKFVERIGWKTIENLGKLGKTRLTWKNSANPDFREIMERCKLELIDSGWGLVVNYCCECGPEHSGSIKTYMLTSEKLIIFLVS